MSDQSATPQTGWRLLRPDGTPEDEIHHGETPPPGSWVQVERGEGSSPTILGFPPED